MIVAASGGLGQEEDERRQRQRGEGETHRGEGARGRRLGARVEIHHRPREAARHRVAAGEACADIGRPQTDQFLVGVDALAFLGRKRLRDGNRFHEADDRDQQRRDEQRRDEGRATGQAW